VSIAITYKANIFVGLLENFATQFMLLSSVSYSN